MSFSISESPAEPIQNTQKNSTQTDKLKRKERRKFEPNLI